MRIGIDLSCLGVEGSRTRGFGIYVQNVVQKLLSIDTSNTYILFYRGVAEKMFAGDHIEHCFVTKRSGTPREQFIQQFYHLPLAIRRSRVDVMYNPVQVDLAAFQPCPAYVVTIHDLIPQIAGKGMLSTKEKILWAVDEAVAKRADMITTVSENTRQDVMRLFRISPEKIRVVYGGVNESYRPVAREQAKKKMEHAYQIREDFILYVGAFETRKNVPLILEALERLRRMECPRRKLVIVGNISPQNRGFAEVYRRVLALGLRDDVIFTGFVPDKDLPYFYSAADVFVFPTSYEGFGLPVIEAMACGTPVVTSNISSLPEICGDAARLIPPGDVDALTDSLKNILLDQDLRRDMSVAGLSQAAKFSWRRNAEEMMAVFSTLRKSKST